MQEDRFGKIVAPLLAWYRVNRRLLPWREDREPYHVWVSEIMLQQTRVEAVIPYYRRFMARCPDIASLAACGEEELLKLWEGLGYYSRVRNMKKAAQEICEEYYGQFPAEYEEILALPGIGAYTAGAIASIAFGKAVAAVDGNVLRVVTRLTQDGHDIADAKFRRQVAKELERVYPAGACGDFTQSLMELGAVVCVPNGMPKCKECPLRFLCGAYRDQTQTQYPVRRSKAARKVQEKTVLILCYKDKIALNRRDAAGLLAGLWEIPNLDGFRTQQEAEKWLAGKEIAVKAWKAPRKEKGIIKHIFTHVEWHMMYRIAVCEAVSEESGFTWFTKEEIAQQVALPTAFKKVYDKAESDEIP